MQCPYCYSEIPDKATICKYCTQNVVELINAYNEIEILKSQLKEIQQSKDGYKSLKTDKKHFLDKIGFNDKLLIQIIIIVLYVSGSILFYYNWKNDISIKIIYTLSAIAGTFSVLVSPKKANLWVLFTIGLSQFPVYLLFWFSGNKISTNNLLPAVSQYSFQSLLTALFIFTGGLLGGFIAFLARHTFDLRNALSLGIFVRSLESNAMGIDRLKSIILTLTGFLSSIFILIGLFNK